MKKSNRRENPCGHDIGPELYIAWHEWADEHVKAGSECEQCPTCKLWVTTVDKRSPQVKKRWSKT